MLLFDEGCSDDGIMQQDKFIIGMQQACEQVVTMLLFYQINTRLPLTTCQQHVFKTGL